MRPVVLLDVDGILADFITAALRVCAYHVNGKARYVAHDDIDTWEISEAKALSLPPESARELKDRYKVPGFASAIPVYPGAQAGVARLRQIADVYAVTAPMSRSATWQSERENWLVDHFQFDRNDIVQTGAKHLVHGDVLVEDKTSTLVRWCGRWATSTGILWTREYNVRDDVGHVGNLRRMGTWQPLIEYVETLAS